jgi:predicted O-methyltransferase YrrM
MTIAEIEWTETLDGVGGWLHADEAAGLARSVVEQPPRDAPLLVVEIGSWKGRSTIALGLAAQERGDARVVAIDPHLGDNGEYLESSPTFDEFWENVDRAGVGDVVEARRLTSHDARPTVDDRTVGVLFVDGSHRYEDVRRDIDEWSSTLVDGAIVAFNDSSKPGVFRALRETVLRPRSGFRAESLVRSTAFLRYGTTPLTTDERWQLRRFTLVLAARRAAHPLVALMPAGLKRWGNRVTSRAVAR